MKKLSFFITLIIAVLIVLVYPFSVNRLIFSRNKNEEKPAYSTIIDVWQLDMIEGGKGSRRDFLLDCAKKFEKSNNGVLVAVSVHTKTDAEDKMKNGIYPDLISFSPGLEGVMATAKPLRVRQEFGGNYNKKTYAAAWAMGGYVLITKKGVALSSELNCYVSQAEFTQPLIAYYLSEYRFSNLIIEKPLDAYTKFLSDKKAVLLGTQRDIFRLTNRNVEFDAIPIEVFSDLFQYISVLSDDDSTRSLCDDFVDLLIASDSDIDNIGMLSPNLIKSGNEQLRIFDNFKPQNTLSILHSSHALIEMQSILVGNSKNEQEKLERIKNIVQ